ncbi:MAG: cytochrome c oxidase subunit II [Candidatus Velthaea sp.]
MAQTVRHKSVNLGPGFWPVTVVLGLLSIAASIFWIVVPTPMGLDQAADTAVPTDILFKALAVVGSIMFIYVAGYIVFFSIVFRRPKNAPPNTIGVQIHDQPVLEFWWTVIPTVLILGLAIVSVQLLSNIYNTAGDVLTMEAIGYQFGFQYRYPKLANPVSGEMHLPVNTPVTVHVTSRDVIHGFWIPEVRIKQDMVPGLVNTVRFTPTKIGRYEIECTQFCGVAHSAMRSILVVDSQRDFAKWFARQGGSADTGGGGGSAPGAAATLSAGDVKAGQKLFGQRCSTCHSTGPFSEKIVGPGLGALFNDKEHPKLVNGKDVTPTNIADIITNGYQGDMGVMPSAQMNQIANKDVANLTAYLVSLSKK